MSRTARKHLHLGAVWLDIVGAGTMTCVVPGALHAHHAARLLAVAWVLLGIGALVLLLGYPHLPATVVLYRPPWAHAPTMAPKSFLTVGRVALMGVGQLGAATAMVIALRGATGAVNWMRFWYWCGLAAGVKTLLECVGLLVPRGRPAEQALTWSAFIVVGLFVSSAAWWWWRGELRRHPPVTGAPRIALFAALACWAAFAIAPRVFT